MTLEFDHLFIFTSVEAPEADRLVELGLIEGQRNVHPGQGTANRRFFFRNAMLEFLWVQDEPEVRSPLIEPTRLWERSCYRQTGYSPFGICFRAGQQAEITQVELPCETWAYRPPYLPDPLQINVARNEAYPGEPMLFSIPFGGRPDASPVERRQPLEHPIGFEEITGLRMIMPQAPSKSAAIRVIEQAGLVSFVFGREHLAEVSFDRAQQGQMVDFRPRLPLLFRW